MNRIFINALRVLSEKYLRAVHAVRFPNGRNVIVFTTIKLILYLAVLGAWATGCSNTIEDSMQDRSEATLEIRPACVDSDDGCQCFPGSLMHSPPA